jgi:ABC-2 type transport system permease protein
MNRGLMLRALREVWPPTLLLGCALMLVEGILAYVLPRFAEQFSEQIREMQFVQTIIKAMLGADVSAGLGPEMFMAIPWVHPVVLAVVWAHAIVCCTRVPAGEVDRGTIDVLLGLPVSRWGLMVSESAVWLASGVVVVAMGVAGSRLGGVRLAPWQRPELARIVIVAANLFCVYFAVGAFSWLMSALSDRRGRAITSAMLVLLASFLLNYLAQFWSVAEKLSWLSLLSYHRPLEVLRDGKWPLKNMAVLIGAGAALWTAAGVVFSRRDLSTI